MSTPATNCQTDRPPLERRFQLRADLDIAPQLQSGDQLFYVVKNPVSLEYYRFRPDEYAVLKLIRGNTATEICDAIEHKLGRERPAGDKIESFLGQLLAAGLIVSDAERDGDVLLERSETVLQADRRSRLANPLYIKFPGVDPERLLNWLYPRIRPAFSPLGIVAAVSVMLLALGTVVVNAEAMLARIADASLSQFLTPQTLVSLWVAVGVSKVLHELGHGLTCKHFGGECHDMGMLLLVFSPCLYCDTSDAWTMPNKWHRMAISAAGIYVELLIASAALLVWWWTADGIVHQVALALMTICSLNTFLINANPLMRFDGYYLMSDLIEIPNLRAKGRQAVQAVIDRFLLGLPAEARTEFPPEKRRGLLMFYAVAASIYRILLMTGILFFMYRVLRPYGLGSVSIGLACWAAVQLFVAPVWRTVSRAGAAWREHRPPGFVRIGVSAALVAGLIWFCLCVRLPRSVTGVFVLEGVGQQSVFTAMSGRLVEAPVTAGQFVHKGDVLARLTNPELDLEIERLNAQIGEYRIAVDTYQTLDQRAEAQRAQALLRDVQEELNERLDQRRKLTIRAACDGYVVPAERPSGRTGTTHGYRTLRKWLEAPLQEQNIGAYFPVGVHLCDLQPTRDVEPLLYVDQGDVTFVDVGQRVEFLLDGAPGRVFGGRVTGISESEAEEVPLQLLSVQGGELAADWEDGRFVAYGRHFQVGARLGEDTLDEVLRMEFLPTGFRGRAKISTGSWTIWEMVVRKFQQIMQL